MAIKVEIISTYESEVFLHVDVGTDALKKNADYSRQRVINQSFGFEITRIQFGVWVEKKTACSP